MAWDECFEQVNKCPGGLHKSFETRQLAEEFVKNNSIHAPIRQGPATEAEDLRPLGFQVNIEAAIAQCSIQPEETYRLVRLQLTKSQLQ
jgi:Caulimovirus viroplasmin